MKKVCVLIPIESILYWPLYCAIADLNKNKSEFEWSWKVSDPSQPIECLPADKDRLTLYRTIFDPTFSPVIDPAIYESQDKSDDLNYWFSLGDPLRALRLVTGMKAFGSKSALSFKFEGTLVSRLAFWLVLDLKRSGVSADDIARVAGIANNPKKIYSLFNYVSCHSEGMTGYHLAEHILDVSPRNNPLAPALPGEEISRFLEIVRADTKRSHRTNELDPVFLGAVTSELLKLFEFLGNPANQVEDKEPLYFDWKPVEDLVRIKAQDPEFIMTALISRVTSHATVNALIKRAADELKDKIDDYTDLMKYDRSRFKESISELFKRFREDLRSYDSKTMDYIELGANRLDARSGSRKLKEALSKLGQCFPDKPFSPRAISTERTIAYYEMLVKQDIEGSLLAQNQSMGGKLTKQEKKEREKLAMSMYVDRRRELELDLVQRIFHPNSIYPLPTHPGGTHP